jgi:hypothetical protein
MDEQILIEITIQQYLEMLRSGKETNLLKQISELLSSKISGVTGGFDLALFQLQKDLLLIQCKWFIAYLEFDEINKAKYSKRIEELKKQIDKKTVSQKDKGESNAYKSFLEWLLVLKKYYGSDIDRSNDLLYLVSATEQMMKFYENQKQQYENQKVK